MIVADCKNETLIKDKLILENTDGRLHWTETEKTSSKENKVYKIAVSNGSVTHGHGTFGWIKATDSKTKVEMNGTVEGNLGTMTLFQTKAQGLVNLIWSDGVTQDTKIYLDNKSVVKKVNEDIAGGL